MCYHSHPALKIGEYEVYGGSCNHPAVLDADVYIGFDYGMRLTAASYPWNAGKGPVEVYFPITDMQAPSDPAEFINLVTWAAGQIRAGKKVHAGCIGGHGRTGTFFAALVAHMLGEKDAVTYVRNGYCNRAVETSTQIKFLQTHFGITPVEGSKAHRGGGWSPAVGGSSYDLFRGESASGSIYGDAWGSILPQDKPKAKARPGGTRKASLMPVQSQKNIWISREKKTDTV
ncbi:hypothetical protein WK13_34795 [Burkholderia ubonensis]|nr:hypothetical protein WK13_34795 [Burkholderia ubonensis]